MPNVHKLQVSFYFLPCTYAMFVSDSFTTVKCVVDDSSVCNLIKTFPASVFARSVFQHHRSPNCTTIQSSDKVLLHFKSTADLPSILRTKCDKCRHYDVDLRAPLKDVGNVSHAIVLSTLIDYHTYGVGFVDSTGTTHALLTCPLLRARFPEPIPLSIVRGCFGGESRAFCDDCSAFF